VSGVSGEGGVRLHWFSPLPPARSGIADYTAELLPFLSSQAEIVLWTDQEKWDRRVEAHAQVRRFRADELSWRDILSRDCGAEIPLYHIGNNGPLHHAIWNVSRRLPGISVLHDSRLQHLFVHIFRDASAHPEGYVDLMSRMYGADGGSAARTFLSGGFSTEHMAERYPLASAGAQGSLMSVVHSSESAAILRNEGFRHAFHLAFPYASVGEEPERSAGPPFRIVLCGYIGPNRRVDAFFRALATFPQRDAFRVDVYGPVWDPEYVRQLIAQGGLSSIVSLHGFVPYRELDDRLRGAHLAVNLRFPTMGEASMSQLQLWDHGIVSLVSPVGWYAEAPEDTVLYVRPDHESDDIHRHLAAFRNDPRRYYRFGDRGREIVRTMHAPDRYVRTLIEIARAASGFAVRRAAVDTARRLGSDLARWCSPMCAGLIAERLASATSCLFDGSFAARRSADDR